MASSWQLKDFVFASFMAIGVLLAALITQPIAALIPVPGIRTILWAPLAGIFLTLGMARLRRAGAVTLILAPVALLLALVNPIIMIVLLSAAFLCDGVMAVLGGYGDRIRRLWGNLLYFEATVLIGVVSAVTGLTAALGVKAPNLQLWILAPAVLVALGVAALGWWLGERVVGQLQKAGKLDL